MQPFFYHWIFFSQALRGLGGFSLVKKNSFLAGRWKEQGTALSPPNFSALFSWVHSWVRQPLCCALEIGSSPGAANYQHHGFFMAGREEEQGTAPFPPYHRPVLPDEVGLWMDAKPGELIIDGTLGGGGHSELFLRKNATVLGIDRDPQAIEYASNRLRSFGTFFRPFLANYAEMRQHPGLADGQLVDGVLLDLGVSSHQIDTAERGFSFQKDGPLDMRMGPDAALSAEQFVNEASEDELLRALRDFGEEPQARRICRLIVERRKKKAFHRTGDLASCIEQALGRHGRIHPATRTFQAIRMRVNQELAMLIKALAEATACLKPNGRLLVITFHSLEDKIAKHFYQHHAKPMIDDPTWPAPRENSENFLSLPVRKAIGPGQKELSINPRARSAKLRVALRNTRPHLPS